MILHNCQGEKKKTDQKRSHEIRLRDDSVHFLERSEEACLEFDGWCGLHGGLSLPGCGFGSAAGLVGSYSRFQPDFKLRGGADDYFEGSGIEGANPHQVL